MSAPREIVEALDSLNHVAAEAIYAGHALGAYLMREPAERDHKAIRAAAADVNAASRRVITKFDGVITLARQAEKARAGKRV